MKVLLTGSNGFLGKALVKKLVANHIELLPTVRKLHAPQALTKPVVIGNIDAKTQWQEHIIGCDVVIHCAARVHIMNDNSDDVLEQYREVNTQGTLNLAKQAIEAGVKRFVFISSIKVLGESTSFEKPYKHNDPANPLDPYGVSKSEAEIALQKLSDDSNMQVVIIRPTLVYGPCVKANFLTMMNVLNKRVPLPLGAITNKRSLLALDNLVDLIYVCLDHPNAANQTFLVSDDRDVSTTQLLKLIGNALHKKAVLLPLPMSILMFAAKMLGKNQFAQRLCGSLQVDISHTKQTLGWSPPFSMEESIAKTVDAYRNQQSKNKIN